VPFYLAIMVFSVCVCVCCLDAAAQQHPEAVEEEETPNYDEKAHEIVQSILQEVVNTVAGGEMYSVCSKKNIYIYIYIYLKCKNANYDSLKIS